MTDEIKTTTCPKCGDPILRVTKTVPEGEGFFFNGKFYPVKFSKLCDKCYVQDLKEKRAAEKDREQPPPPPLPPPDEREDVL